MIVDVSCSCLADVQLLLHIVCSSAYPTSSPLHPLVSYENSSINPLAEFPDLTQPIFSASAPSHRVTHQIPASCLPLWTCPLHLSPEKLHTAEAEIDLGITQPSFSQSASPLYMVSGILVATITSHFDFHSGPISCPPPTGFHILFGWEESFLYGNPGLPPDSSRPG